MPKTSTTTYIPRFPKAFINQGFQIEQKLASDLSIAQARDYNILLAEIRAIQEFIGLSPNWQKGVDAPFVQGGGKDVKPVFGISVDPNLPILPNAPLIDLFPIPGDIEKDSSNLSFVIHNFVLDLISFGSGVDLLSTNTGIVNVSNTSMFPDSGNAVIRSVSPGSPPEEFITFSKLTSTTLNINTRGVNILGTTQNGNPAQDWKVVTNPIVAKISLVDSNYNDINAAFAMQSLDGDWWRISISNSGHIESTKMTFAPDSPI